MIIRPAILGETQRLEILRSAQNDSHKLS